MAGNVVLTFARIWPPGGGRRRLAPARLSGDLGGRISTIAERGTMNSMPFPLNTMHVSCQFSYHARQDPASALYSDVVAVLR